MTDSTHSASDHQSSVQPEFYSLSGNGENGTWFHGISAGTREHETLRPMQSQPMNGYQAQESENTNQESLLGSWSVPYGSSAGSVWNHKSSSVPMHNAAQSQNLSRHLSAYMSTGDTYGCKSILIYFLLVRSSLMLNFTQTNHGHNRISNPCLQ